MMPCILSCDLNQSGIIIAGSERENELNAALTDYEGMAEHGDAEMRLLHLELQLDGAAESRPSGQRLWAESVVIEHASRIG